MTDRTKHILFVVLVVCGLGLAMPTNENAPLKAPPGCPQERQVRVWDARTGNQILCAPLPSTTAAAEVHR